MKTDFDVLTNRFIDQGVGIDPAFLSQKLSDGLYEHILELQEDGMMTAAGIGNQEIKDTEQKMRGDKIYWMDKDHSNIYEKEFLQMIGHFTEHLNESCYTGINSYEFHYAVYGEGKSYKKHRDSFRNDDSRKYSFINYLNKDWDENDGGQLWIHNNEEIQKILPHEKTAVFFRSDETEHEVTTANRERMSITGWLKRIEG